MVKIEGEENVKDSSDWPTLGDAANMVGLLNDFVQIICYIWQFVVELTFLTFWTLDPFYSESERWSLSKISIRYFTGVFTYMAVIYQYICRVMVSYN